MSRFDDSKAAAHRARGRLKAQIALIRTRAQPKEIARDIKDNVRKQVITLVGSAANQPKTRSAIAFGAISAGLAYLFRKPLLNALNKRLTRETNDV